MKIICHNLPDHFILELPKGEALDSFKKLLNRALNTWPDAAPEWKELADRLEYGSPLQNYYSQNKG